MVHSAIGWVLIGNNRKQQVFTEIGKSGFALFGPYITLDPGHYSVSFGIEIPECWRSNYQGDEICAYIEVVANEGARVLIRRPLFAAGLKKDGATHTLNFQVSAPGPLEFRAYTMGVSPLTFLADRPVSASLPRGRFAPILSDDAAPHSQLFAEHFGHFRDLHEKGAEVRPSANGTEVNMFGISMMIKNYDDFQLINEILILRGYNFVPSRDVCVLDVGMNIGLASLYFACMERVKFVYGFEPFRPPFARALENVALNPGLKDKIRPLNYGLGSADEELTVFYDEAHTLDVSVRGSLRGKLTKITIRNAATVMTEIAAAAQDLDIVIKLDCEGSEFPIIEALDAAGLLQLPRIYMMEWHKATGKTQKPIVSQLTRAGFEVFDHSNPFDPYAGHIYAVRSQ